MKRTWLVLDMDYLGWRALHALKGLSRGEVGTLLTYRIFQDILKLQDEHATRDLVFCFDHGVPLRKKLLPSYKEKRHSKNKWTPKQAKAIKDMKRQVALLRTSYLTKIGYRNVFYEEGYEADDIIASVVNNLRTNHSAIIVSADKDLYQLLHPTKTSMWNPTTKKWFGWEDLIHEFGISPPTWPSVKAVAGCVTDEIPGIVGVGEKTAIDYLFRPEKVRKDLIDKISKWIASAEYKRNLRLVKLPFEGCPKFEPCPDEVDPDKWRKLCDRLGMRSIRGKCPGQLKGFGFPTVKVRRSGD